MNTINFLDVDSYKISHWKQLPHEAEYAQSYIESRGCKLTKEQGGYDYTVFFGLQFILKDLKAPTMNFVNFAEEIVAAHFGNDEIFNFKGWKEIAKLGYIPLRIKAVPEGTIVNNHNVLAVVENTLPGYAWLVGWFETQLLRIWYPTTVATTSNIIKRLIKQYLEETGTPEDIRFKLHDFGSRGATSQESASIGGAAHLVNFMGTDTFVGIQSLLNTYVCKGEHSMPGVSIPASEHSTVTSWGGEEGEIKAFENMITQFGGDGKLYACVSDSYDLWAALDKWKALEKKVLQKGGTLVIRPDSGDPVKTPVDTILRLMDIFGYTVNSKGYKVLPDHIRVIQGDGVDFSSINDILANLLYLKISADNIAFGMGGALLQKCDRDTYKFAMKMSAIFVNGKWVDVFKDPKTDPGKASKKGLLALTKGEDGKFLTVREENLNARKNYLETIFFNGKTVEVELKDVRERAGF